MERAPSFSEIIKKVVMEALSSWPLSCRLLTAPGAAGGEISPAAEPCCVTAAPPAPTNRAFSHAAPQAPGTPSPTTDGTRSRTPGKGRAAPPAAPPARQRAGPPRPPPSPPQPFPSPQEHSAPRGRPGQPVFLLHWDGGRHAATPLGAGGSSLGARWLQPPPSHPRLSQVAEPAALAPGFIPQCLLAPYFIT